MSPITYRSSGSGSSYSSSSYHQPTINKQLDDDSAKRVFMRLSDSELQRVVEGIEGMNKLFPSINSAALAKEELKQRSQGKSVQINTEKLLMGKNRGSKGFSKGVIITLLLIISIITSGILIFF